MKDETVIVQTNDFIDFLRIEYEEKLRELNRITSSVELLKKILTEEYEKKLQPLLAFKNALLAFKNGR